MRYCFRFHLERLWKNYNNSAKIAALSSKDILNQIRDLGVNIKFLLPLYEYLPSNPFHHHNPVMSEQPSSISHPAHTRDFSEQIKTQFCSQTATNAVKQGQYIHYSD
jgi:hypothetical protein